MTEPFDWVGLFDKALEAYEGCATQSYGDAGKAAAAYLHERIEAAFVPVSAAKALMDEKHKEAAEAKLWFTKAQEWRQIAARAEAAEAKIERLTAQLAEARQALAAIRDGDVPREAAAIYRTDGKPSKHDQCEHGVWHYEDCGSCISNFAAQALGEPA